VPPPPYLAEASSIFDLELGDFVVYFAGGEYVPGPVVFGVLTDVAEVEGVGRGAFRPVRVAGYRLPQKLYVRRPIFVCGSAQATSIDALTVGAEILYGGGRDFIATIVHGRVSSLFPIRNPGVDSAEFRPVLLDTYGLPMRLMGTRPLLAVTA